MKEELLSVEDSNKSLMKTWESLRTPHLLPCSNNNNNGNNKAVLSSDLLVQLHGAEFCAAISDLVIRSPLCNVTPNTCATNNNTLNLSSHYSSNNTVKADSIDDNNNRKNIIDEEKVVRVVYNTLVEPLQWDLSAHYGSHAIRRGNSKTLGLCFGRRSVHLQYSTKGKIVRSHVPRNAHLWQRTLMHKKWCHRCGIRLITNVTVKQINELGVTNVNVKDDVKKSVPLDKEDKSVDNNDNVSSRDERNDKETCNASRWVCVRCFKEKINALRAEITNNDSKHNINCNNKTLIVNTRLEHGAHKANLASRVKRNRRKHLSWRERRKQIAARKETHKLNKSKQKISGRTQITVDMAKQERSEEKTKLEFNFTNALPFSVSSEQETCNTNVNVSVVSINKINQQRHNGHIAVKSTTSKDNNNNKNSDDRKSNSNSISSDIHVNRDCSTNRISKISSNNNNNNNNNKSSTTQQRSRSSRHRGITCIGVNAKMVVNNKQTSDASKKALDVMSKLGF